MLKRRSVLYTWGLSYLLLVLLMITTALVMGYQARQQLMEEYKSITQTLHGQTSRELDSYFGELEDSAYQITKDYLVNDFLSDSDPSGAKYYSLTPMQDMLSVHVLQLRGNTQQYLYMHNIQKALSSESIYRLGELRRQLRCEDTALSDFSALLTQPHYHDVVIRQTQDGGYTVWLLTSVPLLSQAPKGVLIQVLDNGVLEQIIGGNAVLENSTSVLMDAGGRVVCGEGSAEVMALLENAELQTVKNSELQLAGDPYWIQTEELAQSGWTLLTVVPMASIAEKSKWVFTNSLPILLAATALMSVVCVGFAYWHYRPLKRLRRTVVGENGKPGQNEFEQLGVAFGDMRESLLQMQRIQLEQRRQVSTEFLRSCLEHDILLDEDRLRLLINRLEIQTQGSWFGVLLVEINGMADLLPDETAWNWLELLREDVQNTSPSCHAELFTLESRVALLINCEDPRELQRLLDLASRRQQPDMPQWCCAVSRPRKGYGEIHLAYLEACELLEYYHEKDRRSRIALPPDMPASPRFSAEQETLLVRYILAGNAAEAVELLELVVRNNFIQMDMGILMARCLTADVISGIIKGVSPLGEVWQSQAALLEKDLYRVRYVAQTEELAEILRKVVSRTAAACAAFNASPVGSRSQPAERILKCVEEHYRDPDFNVSRAAEYLDMNVAYLSKTFKSQTGVGLLSYINSLRINYAKECMSEGGMTASQAAQAAGFDNLNTFIRNFKRFEGIAPGSFTGE